MVRKEVITVTCDRCSREILGSHESGGRFCAQVATPYGVISIDMDISDTGNRYNGVLGDLHLDCATAAFREVADKVFCEKLLKAGVTR